MAQAFNDLNRTFGWLHGPIPQRATVLSMTSGASFLDEGPYFDRVRAMFSLITHEGSERHRVWAVAQAERLLNYIENPAPIDAWKADIGTEATRPRLRHIITAWALRNGLETQVNYPETMMAAVDGEAAPQALTMIELAIRSRFGTNFG